MYDTYMTTALKFIDTRNKNIYNLFISSTIGSSMIDLLLLDELC